MGAKGLIRIQDSIESLQDDTRGTRSYPRLDRRWQDVLELSRQKRDDDKYLMELDSLLHVMERLSIYEDILEHVKKIGGKRVIDIGCANGHQSEVFIDSEVKYSGLELFEVDFFNRDTCEYKVATYPCELNTSDGDVGVSVLCLTWNCFLWDGEKTLHQQCAALKRDFSDCILYTTSDKLPVITQYFAKVDRIGMNLYHFSN